MNRLEQLKKLVENLYFEKFDGRADWADDLYDRHVKIVCKYAEELANKEKANVEYCVAGALLHDIADTKMQRENERHEEESTKLATELLTKTGFDEKEIKFILEEIIEPHGCKEKLSTALEGKILATADAMAHLTTNFYLYFRYKYDEERDFDDYKSWVLSKIERDFHKKIFFDDVKERVRPDFEAIKRLFSK